MTAEEYFNNGFGEDVQKVHRNHVIDLMTNFAKHYHNEQLILHGVSIAKRTFNSEEELLQFIYLYIPLAIKPTSKTAKSKLVTPFTSMYAFKKVCENLANKLFNEC